MKLPSAAADKQRSSRPDTARHLSIRAAGKPDAAPLARLMSELGYPTRTAEMEMRLESILNDSKYRTFVAVRNGEVCGMIGTCALCSHEHNSPGGRIMALVVSEAERGNGVGKELIQVAENDFISRNITRIALNTRFQREGAHRFYERLGYKKNGFRFVKNLEGLAD